MNSLTRRTFVLSQKGFTLVELMIVVAIIGILASIAVPNYQKYQAKARTTEAKLYLASIYTAEKSFMVEYTSHTICLQAAGFAPELGSANNTARYYSVGVGVATTPNDKCGPSGDKSCDGVAWGNGSPTCTPGTDGVTNQNGTAWTGTKSAAPGGGAAVTIAELGVGTTGFPPTMMNTTFEIPASGHVNPSLATSCDVWTINEAKIIKQATVGY